MKGLYVYFLYNHKKDLLYIGKTGALRARLGCHISRDLGVGWKNTIDNKNIIIFECQNACDLDVYETYFINKYKPLHNKDKVFNTQLSFEPPEIISQKYDFSLQLREKNLVLKAIRRYLFLSGKYESLTSDEQLEVQMLKLDNSSLIRLLESISINHLKDISRNLKSLVQKLKEKYYLEEDSDLIIVEFILSIYPWLKKMILRIGFNKTIQLIEKEKYNQTNILRNFSNNLEDNSSKIRELLRSYPEIRINTFLSAKRLKEIFKGIYLKLGIKKAAKSTDLKEYYLVQERNKRIKGVLTSGYTIIQER